MHLKIDSPWIQAGIKLTNLLILNFWFVIGCLPMLTIGASLTATCSVCLKMSEDSEEFSITRSFWKAWKDNLARGILYTALSAVVLYTCWLNWQIFDRFASAPVAALIACVLGLVLLMVHLIYLFPLEARYENLPMAAMANSRKMVIRFFVRTLALAVALGAQYMIFYRTAPILSYIGLFIGPACMIYTLCAMTMPIFRILEKDSMAYDGFAISSSRS